MENRDLSGMKVNPYAKKKAPEPKYNTRVQYDFLSYLRLVMRWAFSNHDLTKPEIELMLYLYGEGNFSQRQFSDYYRTLGLYQIKGFTKFKEDGWIKQFRARSGKQCALYSLTSKGLRLCSRMHKMCTGEEPIPVMKKTNKMAESKKVIDKHYLTAIKRMNRRSKE